MSIFCGHGGEPCPVVNPDFAQDGQKDGVDEDDNAWQDEVEDEELPETARDQAQEIEEEVQMLRSFFGHSAASDPLADSIIVVVDVSGVHSIALRYCYCPNAKPKHEQLLDLALYPTSHIRPRTAFTLAVLDDFLLQNRECQTSAMSYYSMLRRRTNYSFPQLVPVSVMVSALRVYLQFAGSLPRVHARCTSVSPFAAETMEWSCA